MQIFLFSFSLFSSPFNAAVNALNGKTEEIEEDVAASGSVVRRYGDIGHSSTGATIYANLIMQKISSEKCNVHISAAMTALAYPSNENFNVFDMDKVESLLGVASLDFSFTDTRVFIWTISGAPIGTESAGYGLGLQDNSIARYYDAGGSAGGWSSARSDVYHAGNLYYIDIFGASYTLAE